MARTTLTREQRDALHDEVMLDFTGLGDLAVYVEKENWRAAQNYRQRFEDDYRLLDDIGWNPLDGRETYTLTMPTEQRERLFRRFLDGAEGCLRDHAVELRDPEVDRDYLDHAKGLADRDLELRSVCLVIEAGIKRELGERKVSIDGFDVFVEFPEEDCIKRYVIGGETRRLLDAGEPLEEGHVVTLDAPGVE